MSTKMMRQPTVGVVIALASEAHALFGARGWSRTEDWRFCRKYQDDHNLIGVQCGTGMRNASAAAQWLITEDATVLGAWGIAGSLHPDIQPGDLIIPSIVLESGCNAERYRPDSVYGHRAGELLIAAGLRVHKGPLVSTSSPVLTIHDKALLYQQSRALGVDLESAAVAAVARRAGMPFFCIRAACDPANRDIPPLLTECLKENGRIAFSALVRVLVRRPLLICTLLRLRKDFNHALSSLARAWHIQTGLQGWCTPRGL